MCSVIGAIGLLSQYGQMQAQQQQYEAQARAYEAQAQAAEFNKRLSDRKQEQIAENALVDRKRLDDKYRRTMGQISANAGAGGFTLEGSPLDIMASSADEYNRDVNIWDANKNNDVYDEYVRGVNYQNQANTARASAANARQQASAARRASILGMAGSIYGTWANSAKRASTFKAPDDLAYKNKFTGVNPFGGYSWKSNGMNQGISATNNGYMGMTMPYSEIYTSPLALQPDNNLGQWKMQANLINRKFPNPLMGKYRT